MVCSAIDGHTLVGMVSQSDLAKALSSEKAGELIEAISAAASTPSRRRACFGGNRFQGE